jgi:hypothetical protein
VSNSLHFGFREAFVARLSAAPALVDGGVLAGRNAPFYVDELCARSGKVIQQGYVDTRAGVLVGAKKYMLIARSTYTDGDDLEEIRREHTRNFKQAHTLGYAWLN